MQNYRTTVLGVIGAVLKFIDTYQANGGNLADWKLWAIPAAIAGLGYVAKDAGVTGTAKILVGCLALLTLPSCSTLKKLGASLSTPEAVQIEASLVNLGIQEAKLAGKIAPGDAIAISNGVAIITSPGSTVSKIVPLTQIISDEAVAHKILTPGTGLIIKDTTALVLRPTPAASVPSPTITPPATN